uniref:Expansin-like EG45 domain-containing protein n=1 Tax=Kalanchoe fedtschenkoi TaxID=63787 RepID=A0A7N1A134_KALFE
MSISKMMAYYYHSSSFQSLFPAVSLLLISAVSAQGGKWESATATSTFNGQDLAGCGFENQTEYGGKTAAVSTALYSNGRMCGACFEIKCGGGSSRNCLPRTVQVTAAGEWVEMINGDDQRWVTSHRVSLAGQSLSFHVTSSDGKAVESKDVVPKNWKFGETYEGGQFK